MNVFESVRANSFSSRRKTGPKCMLAAAVVVVLGIGLWPGFGDTTLSTADIRKHIRDRVEAARTCPVLLIEDELCHGSEVLPLFYARHRFSPVWSAESGLLPRVHAVLDAIRESKEEGLNPTDYHFDRIVELLQRYHELDHIEAPERSALLADMDFLLTDAFLVYGSHLLRGRVDPETVEAQWSVERRKADLVDILFHALENDRIRETLDSLAPEHPEYRNLRAALARYRKYAAGKGWPEVPDGPSLRKGDRTPRVALLKARLTAEELLDPSVTTMSPPEEFDPETERVLMEFQERHGLEVDGVLGPKTRRALNVSAGERVNQILVNMERWRWLPQEFERRHILVDIAEFRLRVMEEGLEHLNMKVVVGKPYWKTPVFRGTMTYLVLNPFWNVPYSIAVRELLPRLKENPDYLKEQSLEWVQGWGPEERILDPEQVIPSRELLARGTIRLRQKPGLQNSLGRIKFMFPNRFNVYLHDTPARQLFQHSARAFSHGCIRVENPLVLAEYLLAKHPKWNRTRILEVLETHSPLEVRLPDPVPVYILYWTARAGEDGRVQFREDVYQRDGVLKAALISAPPAA